MQPDIRDALRSIAPTPRRPLDVDPLRRRAERLQRTRRLTTTVAALVLVAGAPAVALQVRNAIDGSHRVPAGGDRPANCAPYGHESHVTVYVSDDASSSELLALQEYLAQLDGVRSVFFISSEEELREFKDIFRDDPELWETLGPRSLPANFRLLLDDPETAPSVADSIEERKIIDDVRWHKNLDEETLLERNPDAQLPKVCLKITSLEDEGGAPTEEFETHFTSEPVTFSGSHSGTSWSLTARTAKSNQGDVGWCSDWRWGRGQGSGMDCMFSSGGDVSGGDELDRFSVLLDPTERPTGGPLAFHGLAPAETVEVQAEADDGTLGSVEVYDAQDELGVPVTLVVGFIDARDVTLRAYDEDGELIDEDRYDLGM